MRVLSFAILWPLTACAGCAFDTAGDSGCDGADSEKFVTGAQACAIAAESHFSSATTPFAPLTGSTCNALCGGTSTTCTLPADVLHAYLAGQAGAVDADGAAVDVGDAETETGSSDAGNAGDSSAAGCPGIDPMSAVSMICTITCGQ